MKQANILDLRPTQFVLGMKEIDAKITKMRAFSKKELQEYCDDHTIPVVLGPHKETYLIDHHHFARVCYEEKISAYSTKLVKDLSDKSEKDFWNHMIREGWTYLYDQFGMGPHSPLALPADVRCMADDPYRSLAWALVDNGTIKKQTILFFEFQWAAFFRRNLDISLHSKSDFKAAIAKAKQLAHSKDAKGLPGYRSI